jgi:hypothetical protein
MCCVLFRHNSTCVSDNVEHIMPHQGPVKSNIHTPKPSIHPWLVIYPQEVDSVLFVLSAMKLRLYLLNSKVHSDDGDYA